MTVISILRNIKTNWMSLQQSKSNQYLNEYYISPDTTCVVDEAGVDDMVAEGNGVTMVTIDVPLELDI